MSVAPINIWRLALKIRAETPTGVYVFSGIFVSLKSKL
jgi:hypothetical protein